MADFLKITTGLPRYVSIAKRKDLHEREKIVFRITIAVSCRNP